MCVSVSLCVCEFDGATLAVWGQTSTWLRRRLLLLHLATSFASLALLAACCMRIAFNRFRSVAARRARSDWGSRSASIRISCCACAAQTTSRRVDAARRSSKLLLLHCSAGLSVCVCVWVLCVCIVCAYCMWSRYTGRASGNQEGVSCSRRLESRFQHKREILFL